MMELREVESSLFSKIGYDRRRCVLEVHMHRGGVFSYVDVPVDVAMGLFDADSKGSYYSKHIRGKYSATSPVICEDALHAELNRSLPALEWPDDGFCF